MNIIKNYQALSYDGKSYWVSVASLFTSSSLMGLGVYIACVQIDLQHLQELEAKWRQRQEEYSIQMQDKAEKFEKAKEAAREFRSEGFSNQQ
jgi:hypothetical protein